MKNYIIVTSSFVDEYVDTLEEIFSRMGWMPERDTKKIILSIPCTDEWIFNWILESDLF